MRRDIPLLVEGDILLPLTVEEPHRLPAELDASVVLIDARYQNKTVTPSAEAQVIRPDEGYAALGEVTVGPIPSNYGRIAWDGSTLTVS